MGMRHHVLRFITVFLVLGTGACGSRQPDSREYQLQGQILSVNADHTEANIKHEDIPGFMAAMTMPYKVKDAKQYEGLAPGDLINAKLIVLSNDAYLTDVKKVGNAPLEKMPEDKTVASSGFELLKDGTRIPDEFTFTDQDGKKVKLQSFHGKAVALTFIYTACPMPTFCPLMDRNFVEMQEKIKADPLFDAHLISVSIDPVTDTPPVLKKHAQKLGADPKIWTFLTGNRDDIDKFAARFGLSTTRAMNDQREITHTLRTVIIDRRGNLVKTFVGNEWKPSQLFADMHVLVGVD